MPYFCVLILKGMLVYKFGGTSVGSPVRMKKVANLITQDDNNKIVVLSAVSGTTNKLIEISEQAQKELESDAISKIQELKSEYITFIKGLITQPEIAKKTKKFIDTIFGDLASLVRLGGERIDKEVVAYGELISTQLFQYYLEEKGVNSVLLPALDFMSLDSNEEPDIDKISNQLKYQLKLHPDKQIYVTQGFICRDLTGQIDNLKRGGSDYTASIIGAAIAAEEVQIWTDIDGMHNNDPRVVKDTFPISELSFDEAAELAYFGAKILHPSSILPAQKFNIPVRLKSTLNENAPGTLINTKSEIGKVKAIAAKDGITAIKIKSSRMLLAHGFLRKVFEIFERHKTSIDMITTSEVAVSVTIDDDSKINEIISELQKFGFVEIDKEQTIICIVGNMISEEKGVLQKIFSAMDKFPVRMVSYGGSKYNISLLTDSKYKTDALINLNDWLF